MHQEHQHMIPNVRYPRVQWATVLHTNIFLFVGMFIYTNFVYILHKLIFCIYNASIRISFKHSPLYRGSFGDKSNKSRQYNIEPLSQDDNSVCKHLLSNVHSGPTHHTYMYDIETSHHAYTCLCAHLYLPLKCLHYL